jgi:maltooligosyltrehalose trehalohydrolase
MSTAQQAPRPGPAGTQRPRRSPVGAEPVPGGGTHFRVWAPRQRRVEVVLESGGGAELTGEGGGYFSGQVAAAGPGARYRYRLDGGDAFPDPASRFQPDGPHGPSEVVDADAYRWGDHGWKGIRLPGQVIYELHVGTFTPEGTWKAAADRLPDLVELGATLLEVMPVADFPGRFGWGYDGVDLFAPTRLYGSPDDMRRFVDRAHQFGLGVILDVVYNHLGPDGNYLTQYSDAYFTKRYATEWGDPINFDGPDSGPVREFFVANAAYWLDEFHLDGLRLDATQTMFDSSADHVLAAIARAVRGAARRQPLGAGSGGERGTVLVAENEPQHVELVRPPAEGGFGLDALWNDDFHHSARVALTGRTEAYYIDYYGTPQEFVSAMKYGYLYQGQYYAWQKKRRGTPSFGVPPAAFVTFLQNHDQVANSGRGHRIHQLTSPGRLRALTALMLLGPGTPMLFQGQEFACSAPFLYFADHHPGLAEKVRAGRREFLGQFPSLAVPEVNACLPDPGDPQTFAQCKLDFSERPRHTQVYDLHRDLLKLRRDDPVIRLQAPRGVDGAVLGEQAFLLRYFGGAHGDRLLLVNLGRDLHLERAPEPLLAPLEGRRWEILWSTESPRYAVGGTAPLEGDFNWRIPGEAAVVLK